MLQKKVLVVGGGPVGLAAALFLNQLGIKPRIIEKNTQFTEYSKALAVNARTMHLLRDIGATQRILREAVKIKEAQMFFNEELVIAHRVDLPIPGNDYNFMTVFPQSRTEAILRDLLKQRNIQLETGASLTKLESSPTSVKVCIEKDGHQDTDNFDYVLGADGAKSACRKLLGIPYLGDTFKPEMYLSDFELHNPPKEHHVETHLWADKALAMIPVTKDTIRLISNVQDYVSLVPKHLQLGKELWKSSFRVNHRTAQTFQKQRVFLAGDAAHVHSPVGGRGMNIGIEDVYVFSRLLDIDQTGLYTSMRKPIIDDLVKKIGRATELFLGKDSGQARKKIPYLLPTIRLLGKNQINRFLLGLDHQIGI